MSTRLSKVLVTGGAGFIGTHLIRRLTEQGFAVTSLDLRPPKDPVAKANYVIGDVRAEGLVERLIEDFDENSAIYHLAATVSVPLCQQDPLESYSNNFTATVIVLEAIRKHAEKKKSPPLRMVFASTAAIYGSMGDDGRALKETDVAPTFLSYYGAQKFASEQAMDQYLKAFRIPSLPFRFFNVFGPGQDPTSPYSGVITVFSRLAKEGKPLPLNGGGIQTRDFISVHDIIEGLSQALSVPRQNWDARPTNLGTGSTVTILQLAEHITKELKTGSKPVSAPPREGDVVHSKADISRAKSLLGFMPKHSFSEALIRYLKTC